MNGVTGLFPGNYVESIMHYSEWSSAAVSLPGIGRTSQTIPRPWPSPQWSEWRIQMIKTTYVLLFSVYPPVLKQKANLIVNKWIFLSSFVLCWAVWIEIKWPFLNMSRNNSLTVKQIRLRLIQSKIWDLSQEYCTPWDIFCRTYSTVCSSVPVPKGFSLWPTAYPTFFHLYEEGTDIWIPCWTIFSCFRGLIACHRYILHFLSACACQSECRTDLHPLMFLFVDDEMSLPTFWGWLAMASVTWMCCCCMRLRCAKGQHTRCVTLAVKALKVLKRLDCRNCCPTGILRLCLRHWFEEQDFGS